MLSLVESWVGNRFAGLTCAGLGLWEELLTAVRMPDSGNRVRY